VRPFPNNHHIHLGISPIFDTVTFGHETTSRPQLPTFP
jgi:hypothetical protein